MHRAGKCVCSSLSHPCRLVCLSSVSPGEVFLEAVAAVLRNSCCLHLLPNVPDCTDFGPDLPLHLNVELNALLLRSTCRAESFDPLHSSSLSAYQTGTNLNMITQSQGENMVGGVSLCWSTHNTAASRAHGSSTSGNKLEIQACNKYPKTAAKSVKEVFKVTGLSFRLLQSFQTPAELPD